MPVFKGIVGRSDDIIAGQSDHLAPICVSLGSAQAYKAHERSNNHHGPDIHGGHDQHRVYPVGQDMFSHDGEIGDAHDTGCLDIIEFPQG